MKVVISQSMYFPWVGLLEQIKLADTFVHYDDVQHTRGFYNRVQVKTEHGIRWITIPLRDRHQGQRIDEVRIDDRADWRRQHHDILQQAYSKTPFCKEMLALVDSVFMKKFEILADVSRASMMALSDYFGLTEATRFVSSLNFKSETRGSHRIHDICVALEAKTYITGHGARNYLDHDLFERSAIRVEYMNYRKVPYAQMYGEFTPYVTALDLVANCGREGAKVICSDAVYWKDFLNEPDSTV
ncbi:MAG: WbqC family protein [Pseudomonadota bacterium]